MINRPHIQLERPTKLKRNVLLLVALVAFAFMGLGAGLGIWSAWDMRQVVADQFNQEQLVMARHISTLVERQVGFLKREVLLLRKQEELRTPHPDAYGEVIRDTFDRVLESGVLAIEIVDPETLRKYVFTPSREWTGEEADEKALKALPPPQSLGDQDVWVSESDIRGQRIRLVLMASLAGGGPLRYLIFHVDVSRFLTPFLSDIRSGRTGYAWVMDEQGNFLYHPNAEFVGKSAFHIREEKYPGVSTAIINFIQKEKMLKGETGTGAYTSGWHRGITGNIKKLVAFCPCTFPTTPPGCGPRRWQPPPRRSRRLPRVPI